MSNASLIYVTASSEQEATKIATGLVEARLVACANIIRGMKSAYWWQGAVQHDDETVLILKTRTELVDRVTEQVMALHSYECPCVVSLPIDKGNPAFLAWIDAGTAASVT